MNTRQLTPQDLARLESVTGGEVTDSDYGRTVTVAAANPADVIEAVAFAATFAMPLSIDLPGAAAAKDGVRITTERLRAIHVDRVSRTAIAQVGALWSDVVDRAAEHDLAPLVQRHTGTGILGTGYGWSAGHVLGIDVVARDGHYRHVTAAADPRLFRRLCAIEPGDVEAGVTTAMTFALFR